MDDGITAVGLAGKGVAVGWEVAVVLRRMDHSEMTDITPKPIMMGARHPQPHPAHPAYVTLRLPQLGHWREMSLPLGYQV